MLSYKLREIGIILKLQEESYTSKASFLDSDFIPTLDEKSDNLKEKHVFQAEDLSVDCTGQVMAPLSMLISMDQGI